jgi:hypothetical protein
MRADYLGGGHEWCVVEVDVEGADDEAWAGTITEFTTGFIQRLGNMMAVATPPIATTRRNVRRSVVTLFGLKSLGRITTPKYATHYQQRYIRSVYVRNL